MFTYNFGQHFTEELMPSLRDLLRPRFEKGQEGPYGEAMLRAAGGER